MTMYGLNLDLLYFAISVAIAFFSIAISIFAIMISRRESEYAQKLWTSIKAEVTGISVRSKHTEQATQSVFDNMMYALITANRAGQQNAAKALTASKKEVSTLIRNPLFDQFSIPDREREKFVEQIANITIKNLQSRLSLSDSKPESLPPGKLDIILNSSENPPIARRYVEFVMRNPKNISVESVRATNYEEYVRILEFLIHKNVLSIDDGYLTIGPEYRREMDKQLSTRSSG